MKGRDYARFFAKVKKVGDCWEWQVGTDKKGYGRFWLNGKNRQAYRVAYEFLIGPLASAFHLDHTYPSGPSAYITMNYDLVKL